MEDAQNATREIVSKRTRIEFREFLVGWTLREIEIEFDSAGIASDRNYQPPESGARRSLVEQFYHTINFRSPDDVTKLLQVYENILKKVWQNIEEAATTSHVSASDIATTRKQVAGLVAWLEKDGYTFKNGRILRTIEAVGEATRRISEATRRNVQDFFSLEKIEWWGRLSQADFLSRLYDLKSMPSTDPRFVTAERDIRKHTEYNDDWDNVWVFGDSRFALLTCSDQEFVRFLAESLHPVVRADTQEVVRLLNEFNRHLAADGWQLARVGELSGRPLFAGESMTARPSAEMAHATIVAEIVDSGYMARQIARMQDAVHHDPELAIGTAKEFVETVCKTILSDHKSAPSGADDLPQLVKQTMKRLKLAPDDVPDSAKGAETIRVLLSNLGSVAGRLAELRNLYGSGHGRHAKASGLGSRHAKLAAGAATVLAVFLFDTHQERHLSGK